MADQKISHPEMWSVGVLRIVAFGGGWLLAGHTRGEVDVLVWFGALLASHFVAETRDLRKRLSQLSQDLRGSRRPSED